MIIISHIYSKATDYECRSDLLMNTVYSIAIVYYNMWLKQYGDKKLQRKLNRREQLCLKFYNLVSDHFTEQRDIKYYADLLCVSPNYLSMKVREVGNISPKEYIDRLVTLEMKYYARAHRHEQQPDSPISAFCRHVLHVPLLQKARWPVAVGI